MPITPFNVDFKKNGASVSATDQAIQILEEVNRQHKNGAKKVGITYSANQEQTAAILDTYNRGGWKTSLAGANQASVIMEIEKLLATTKYQHLQGVYQTVPITTMKYADGGNALTADDDAVQRSLKAASFFMDDGGVLLGWQNQFTKPGHLAIGGGVANTVQSQSQRQMIDNWVHTNLQSRGLTHGTPHATNPSASNKWATMKSTATTADIAPSAPSTFAPHKGGCFTPTAPDLKNSGLSLALIVASLQKGTIPMISQTSTSLDKHIAHVANDNLSSLTTVADLITKYSIKNIMGNLDTNVAVTMVDNSRAHSPGHERTAMKIQFESDAAAKEFAQKLLKEHGIHSLTFGAGVMKNPQNGAIYLTKDDMEKIAHHSGLTKTVNSGPIAYQALDNAYQHSKAPAMTTIEDDKKLDAQEGTNMTFS